MYSFKYTNKMQRYTIFFIAVNALQVSGGFPVHHQELKTVYKASGICQNCLTYTRLNSPMQVVAASKLDIYPMLCVQSSAADDGRRNRLKKWSIESHKLYCIKLHLVGILGRISCGTF